MIAHSDSAMATLRTATALAHQRLEKRLDIKIRFSNLAAYQAHLEKMWGFCAPLEASLRPESFDGALPDYDARRKLPLLTQDLLAVGLRAAQLPSLQRCTPPPSLSDAAAAFGCTYVMEGATLGGRVLLPWVEKSLGLTASHGAAFLGSYRDKTSDMWRDFSAAVEHFCDSRQRRDAAARAAVTTFNQLTAWLCEERQ
jgi:heme oxygenase (biliverdin-IX-beta and delta-forming)